MSSLLSTRAPAHAGLLARPPCFAPADEAIAERLHALCGAGEVRRLVSNLPPPVGYYLLERGGAPPIFLKLLPGRDIARQIEADRFARHVAARGLAASTILPGYPKVVDGFLSIVGYPWIAGRFARGDEADCAAVGRLLARIHLALADYPHEDPARRDTERRLAQLAAAAKLAGGGLRALLARDSGLFDLMRRDPRQVIHGDMNHGNVVFPDDGSDPVALDYEDARISWFPPALDVAFALERFALASEPDDDRARPAAASLLAAYAAMVRAPIFSHRGALGEALRMLALRSLMQLSAAGASPAEAEWEKFLFLHRHAERREALLADLEAPYLFG